MKKVKWNGKTYNSITKLKDELKIPVHRKIRQGWTGDKYMWNGIGYASIKDCSKKTKISESTLSSRFKDGWTGDKYMWNGVGYGFIKDIAEHKPQKYSLTHIYNLITFGITSEKENEDLNNYHTFNGKTYKSLKEMAYDLGISLVTAHRYKQKGYTKDSDLTVHLTPIKYKGQFYRSISKARFETGDPIYKIKKSCHKVNISDKDKLDMFRKLHNGV